MNNPIVNSHKSLPDNIRINARSNIGFALPIIIGIGGLLALVLGICGYFQVGALCSLNQIQSIILMGTGGGVFFLNIAILAVKQCHYLSSVPEKDPILLKIKSGLDSWINQGPEGEKLTRVRASQEIIKCYQNKYSALNLENYGLSSLAPEIGKLANLQRLDVSHNQLTSLPSEIGQLANLEVLYVYNNQLASLPLEIGNLANLKELYVSGNKLTSLPSEMGRLTNLEGLSVHCNQLTSLPPEIGQLANLQRLDANNNQLTSLPPEIGQLANLQRLDASNNQLTSLPSEIGQLTHLEVLDVSWNRLTSLPSEIGRLANLQQLRVFNNQLTSLPSEIGNLANLKELNVSNNQLASLPSEIGNLTNLEVLNVYNNQLASLPSEIGNLANLKKLNVKDNQLTFLPSEIGNLANLEELYAPLNQLTSLPAAIGQLANLEKLNLSYNQLTSLPDEILHLPQSCEINVTNNALSERVCTNLAAIMNREGYEGPIIAYSMANRREITLSLEELLKELSAAAGKDLISLPELSKNSDLKGWLSRISDIADYKTKRQVFASLIYDRLQKAEADPDYREEFAICIKGADDTCGDRMALSVLYLDLLYEIRQCVQAIRKSVEGNKGSVDAKSLSRLAYLLGHGSWALNKLGTVAGNKAASLKFVDEIEVYLAYPVKLKNSLDLPIAIDSMLYFTCSAVTDQDLKDAEKFVLDQLWDKKTYCNILAENRDWQLAMEMVKPKEYVELYQCREKNPDASLGQTRFIEELAELTREVLQTFEPA